MAASGFDSQVGYATESPAGTYTAPTRALEHVTLTLMSTPQTIVSQGIRAGRRHQGRSSRGIEVVGGTITHELSPINIGTILLQAFGAVSTTGSNPYTHVFTYGPLTETSSRTVQVGTPSDNGTVNPFNFLGGQVNGLSIATKVNENVMLDTDWVCTHLLNAGDGDSVAALTAATYSATWAPFTFVHCTLSLAASVYEFDDATFQLANNLKTGRHMHRAATPRQARLAKENGFREATLTVASDFFDLTAMNRAFAGTEVAASLAFVSGANTLTIAGNVRTNMDSPTVDGPQTLKQGMVLSFVSLTSDAAACTATLVNTDSAP